jgi:hypothetical protein
MRARRNNTAASDGSAESGSFRPAQTRRKLRGPCS